jgi:hypothetical protein
MKQWSYPFSRDLSPAQKKLIVRSKHKLVPTLDAAIQPSPAGVLTEGLGANLPRIDQPGQDDAYPHNEAEWRKLEQHLDWLGISWLRYWLFGEQVIPRPGEFHADHDYLQRLIRLHQWAERRDARLILDFGVTPTWLRFKTDNARSYRLSAPADIGRYIEDYALPLVRYVLRELKLKQVRYLSVFNEPFCPDHSGFSFFVPKGVDVFAHYVELFARLRARLDEEGFSADELGLIGPNSHDLYVQPLAEMQKRGLDLLPHLAAVDEHCYRARLDYLPPVAHMPTLTIGDTIATYLRPAVQAATARGKPYFLTEYGTFYYGGITGDRQGPARHEAALTEVEFVIRSLVAGANGAMKWSFINGGGFDGLWQYIETADGSYAPVPNVYYAHAVLGRFTPRGGAIHPVTFTGRRPGHVHGICVRKNGDATVLLVNDHPAEQVRVQFARAELPAKPLHARTTDAVRKFAACAVDDTGSILLNPMSVTALTTIAVADETAGIL